MRQVGRVLIVGGGQAGFQTALSLRQAGFDGDLELFAKEAHPPYQRPPLSKQMLKEDWPEEKCYLRHPGFYPEHRIVLWQGLAAIGLDPQGQRLQTSDGDWHDYDRLVICSGSRLNRLHLPGADLDGVHYLRSLDHSLELAPLLNAGTRLVIAGAGYIGLEVAASARERGCEVTVVEGLPRAMQRSTVKPVAAFMQRRHEQQGVVFRFGRRLQAIEGRTRVEAVVLDDGARLPADLVLKAVGVRPDIGWLNGAGLETGRGIRVDDRCRTSVQCVYAAGDVTEFRHSLFGGWLVLESVQNAVSQGKTAAAQIMGEAHRYEEVPWFWSDQYDCHLKMAGIPQAGDRLVIRESTPNSVSVLSIGEDKLNAVQCVNVPRDYMAGRKLIALASDVDLERLTNPTQDLKELL